MVIYMELNHLKYFYIVARERGFTNASRVLRVQQPAISKMVRQLEEKLGLVLFERQKKQVLLTKAGEEIFNRCSKIFETVEDIVSFSNKEKIGCYGPLRFGASDSVASHLIPDILSGYMQSYPEVRPSVFTGASNMICDEIRENKIEFGVFFTVPEDDAFVMTEVASLRFYLVVSSMQVANQQIRKSFIGSREIDYPKMRSFPAMEMLRAQGIQPSVVISCNNLDAHRKFVLNGLGVALLPAFMVDEDIREKRLSVIYPQKKFFYSLKLVARNGKILSKNATVFLELFKKQIVDY